MILLLVLATTIAVDQIIVSDAGSTLEVNVCVQDADPANTHRIEVYEFPPKDGESPISTHEVSGPIETWDYLPRKGGMYYMRAQSCHPDTGCGAWLSTLDSQPACATASDKRAAFYFEVPTASGGGIDG